MACNINSMKTGQIGKKWGFSGTHRTSYIKKLKCISSPEQNYFAHFAMRYPVASVTNCEDRIIRRRAKQVGIWLKHTSQFCSGCRLCTDISIYLCPYSYFLYHKISRENTGALNLSYLFMLQDVASYNPYAYNPSYFPAAYDNSQLSMGDIDWTKRR